MQSAIWTVVGLIGGFFIGLRTNWLVNRAFEYRAFLHKAMIEVRLMSERLCPTSYDFKKVPRVDSVLRLCADQFEYLGMTSEAKVLRDIERNMTTKLEAALHSDTDVDLHTEKQNWIRLLEGLQPKWLTLLRPKRRAAK